MAKICSNCACYEVCFMANPCRTEDCNINWQPIIVRCKDCKHNVANKEHDPLDATDYTDIVCDYWMSDGNRPDDFCSYGERKANE